MKKERACLNLFEKAKPNGYTTILVSSDFIANSIPSSFFAHVSHSRLRANLIEQLYNYSSIDLIIGGGSCHFTNKSIGGCKKIETAPHTTWNILNNITQINNETSLPAAVLVSKKAFYIYLIL